jgi:hypothetical protein
MLKPPNQMKGRRVYFFGRKVYIWIFWCNIYEHINICIYIYIYVYEYIYMYMNMYVFILMSKPLKHMKRRKVYSFGRKVYIICIYLCIYIYMYILYMYVYIYTYVYINMYMHVYMHMYRHVFMNIFSNILSMYILVYISMYMYLCLICMIYKDLRLYLWTSIHPYLGILYRRKFICRWVHVYFLYIYLFTSYI